MVAPDLRLLDWDVSLLAIAGVDLDSLLVGRDFEADPSGAGAHTNSRNHRSLRSVCRRTVDDEAVVVADTVSTAEAVRVFDVSANKLARSEVRAAIIGSASIQDAAVRNEKAVGSDEAVGQRELQKGVVKNVLLLEAIQVPVNVVGQHDWSFLGQGQRNQFCGELGQTLGVVRCTFVVDTEHGMSDHIAWEALLGFVHQGKGDGGLRMVRDSPIALVIANVASVEGVDAILTFRDIVLLPIKSESTILNTVGIAADNSTEEGVVCLSIVQILFGVIVAHGDILHVAISVRDQERSQSRPIGDQLGGDLARLNGVFLEVIIMAVSFGRAGRIK